MSQDDAKCGRISSSFWDYLKILTKAFAIAYVGGVVIGVKVSKSFSLLLKMSENQFRRFRQSVTPGSLIRLGWILPQLRLRPLPTRRPSLQLHHSKLPKRLQPERSRVEATADCSMRAVKIIIKLPLNSL